MLDEDLARLYEVPVKVLNQQVRRNLPRFPADFMFRMTSDEARALRSQIVTLDKSSRGQHRKYWPLAFTEQGVAMLSGVLHSPCAVDVNVAIMRAFVRLRGALGTGEGLAARMKDAELVIADHDRELTEHATHINEAFAEIRRLKS